MIQSILRDYKKELDSKIISSLKNKIFYYKLDTKIVTDDHFDQLTKVEQEKANSYLDDYHKKSYILRHIILKEILAPYEGEFEYDELGRPRLKDIDVFFSISHSNDYFIAAISPNMIGIDIERIRKIEIYQNMLDLFLTDEELELINKYPERDRLELLYLFWTAKEAFVKAIGHGMKFNLKKIEFGIVAPNHELIVDKTMSPNGRINKKLFVKRVKFKGLKASKINLEQVIQDKNAISTIQIKAK